MALLLRIYPSERRYRLAGAESGGPTRSLADVLGHRGCVAVSRELPADAAPADPHADAVLIIDGQVAARVEVVEVPDERHGE